MPDERLTVWLEETDSADTPLVGGKNSSLGEMLRELGGAGVRVPPGFATTAYAYRRFLDQGDLGAVIARELSRLGHGADVSEVGPVIRAAMLEAPLPGSLTDEIRARYRELCVRSGHPDDELSVAVRSSATAEDLPDASFAGQQETFLHVEGADAVVAACHSCFASLFTDRAISYRAERGFDHLQVALSVGVQQMVASDAASAGVMFSIDTETGFPDVVMISASWGLGESVVSGSVDPDEYLVFKPLLGRAEARPIISKVRGAKEHKIVRATHSQGTQSVPTTDQERRSFVLGDDEILELARLAVAIEDHYARPMDIEWAKDGPDGPLTVVQARPETVQARRRADVLRTYELRQPGRPLVVGEAIGDAIAAGRVVALSAPGRAEDFPLGGVLVTDKTDPDWVPIMKRAAAIVTEHGGRTSHAAIVSRELGLPAVIGTGDATTKLERGREVTVCCAEGDEGRVYDGVLDWDEREIDLDDIPQTRTRVMLNLADPAAALRWWRLPADGVGLARMEFVINNHVRVHPLALVHPERVESTADREVIEELTAGFEEPTQYFVDELAHGVAKLAASCHPRPVVVRMSDFKTNEYANLLGGAAFEPHEDNPMLGWRGASRYYHPGYREGFSLECRAIRKVREEIGLDNVIVMIPFCRSPGEADRVLEVLAAEGLGRGEGGLEVYVMAEIPSNVLLADQFADRFDGFSIGSNDLTQLVLGVDRDSAMLSGLFDESDPAVRRAIEQLVETAHGHATAVGFCGQAPSDRPAYAAFLVRAGVDSISVTPDSFLAVKESVARAEADVSADGRLAV